MGRNMEFLQNESSIIIQNLKDFNIGEILECGQCFRFERLEPELGLNYRLIAFDRLLYIRQIDSTVQFSYKGRPLDMDEFNAIWRGYFDLDRDYAAIKSKISSKDAVVRQAVEYAKGIRMLRQDPWEMLISFIISANNRIPQIKQVLRNICREYGKELADGGINYYGFPTTKELLAATPADLRRHKAGFRDKYIVAATQMVASGQLDINTHTKMPTSQLKKALLAVPGVGEKVAHCIMLFGYGRFDSFPIDTWVRKIMQEMYFNGQKVSAAQIQAFAHERFGGLSGFANQYLFHYIRTNGQ